MIKHKISYIINPKIFIMKGMLTLTPLPLRRMIFLSRKKILHHPSPNYTYPLKPPPQHTTQGGRPDRQTPKILYILRWVGYGVSPFSCTYWTRCGCWYWPLPYIQSLIFLRWGEALKQWHVSTFCHQHSTRSKVSTK
jgi:hypothetical protein